MVEEMQVQALAADLVAFETWSRAMYARTLTMAPEENGVQQGEAGLPGQLGGC
jgi:hypothetical protein